MISLCSREKQKDPGYIKVGGKVYILEYMFAVFLDLKCKRMF